MSFKDSEIILSKVKKIEDSYEWSELNCFYRAFAIGLSSLNEKAYDLFLIYITAYVAYIINGERVLSFDANDSVLKYYNSELKDIFGAEIKRNDFTSYKNMKKKILNTLINNEVVIVPSDLYFLPYCKTYLELHKRHYLIVKGFNERKNLLYILDNMQNELGASTAYSDFMIKTGEVYEMCSSFKKSFDNVSTKNYYWSAKLDTDNFDEKKNKEYLHRLCLKLSNHDINKEFEATLIDKMKEGIFDIDLLHYMEYINTKKLLFASIKKYVDKFYESGEVKSELCNMLDLYLKERERIKILFAVTYQKKVECIEQLEDDIQDLLKMEKEIFKVLNTIIEKGNSCVKERNTDYMIVNNNNADVELGNNKISINLDEDIIYDLWKNADNGVQIYKENNNDIRYFNVDMKMDCHFGGSSHCGIMLILENGDKILFGSLGKLNMAVHKLSDNPEYELYIENYVLEEEIVNLQINSEDKECYFYIDQKEVLKCEIETKIKYYGVFAKTWENCKCSVDFIVKDI
ncbi:MAG: hypothetical protein IJA34_11595 [Lachnospiraceae bacterium]|nr:hypothetical protein [Lachnospiraceae bacterium]